MKLKIVEASHHRNGIAGAGFYAILFDDKDNGRMFASLFDGKGLCAITKVDELSAGNIRMAEGNSWRGDDFESELRPLLSEWLLNNS